MLGEDGAYGGARYLMGRLRHLRQGLSHEVYPAPLPRGTLQSRLDRAFEALVDVAGQERHLRKTTKD